MQVGLFASALVSGSSQCWRGYSQSYPQILCVCWHSYIRSL